MQLSLYLFCLRIRWPGRLSLGADKWCHSPSDQGIHLCTVEISVEFKSYPEVSYAEGPMLLLGGRTSWSSCKVGWVVLVRK